MDLKRDEQFQQYYASMTASPSYSSSNDDTPEHENNYNNGKYNNLPSAEKNGDDYFYEASELMKQNDTYTDDDEDDAETVEKNEKCLDENSKGTTASHYGEISPDTAIATSTDVIAKKKKRKKRDPNKPKGFVCASLKYANANRQRVKDANPNATFQEVVSVIIYYICIYLHGCICVSGVFII